MSSVMELIYRTASLGSILFFLLALIESIGFSTSSVLTSTCFPEVPQKCGSKMIPDVQFNSTVKYYLFTRKSQKIPELLHACGGTLPRNTRFSPKRRLVAIVGGFVNGICQLSVFMDIKDEFLKKGDYNVLLIDTRDAYGFNYVQSIRNLQTIAKDVAQVFYNIQDQTGLKNDLVDLVGHSLGAQLCGLISNHFKVKRITGIDPAGVLFKEIVPRDLRLDDTDAELVDILHCNGGESFPTFSLDYATGDADFYFNGGKIQPSCSDISMKVAKEFDFILAFTLYLPAPCAHMICLYYYQLSINNENGHFKARSCDSYEHFKSGHCDKNSQVTMGVDFKKNFPSEIKKAWPRKYYVDTSDHWPYVVKI